MTEQPLVSIAMPVYNAEKTLAVAIRSILHQTYLNWELIIIDDGSIDGTLTIIGHFKDPRIKLIEGKINLGLAVRLNQAIEISNGKYIARMDADDVAFPERIERQVEYMEDNLEVDLLGTGMVVFDNKGDALGTYPLRQTHQEICRRPWAGFYLPHPTWLGRTNWFLKFKYTPGAVKAQDQDLLLRSYATSRFACLSEILLGYRHESLSLKKILKGRYIYSLNLFKHLFIKERRYAMALLGVCEQLLKGLVDIFAITTGLNYKILSHRSNAKLLDEKILSSWKRVWDQVNK